LYFPTTPSPRQNVHFPVSLQHQIDPPPPQEDARLGKHRGAATAVGAAADAQRAEFQEGRFELARPQLAAECGRLLTLLRRQGPGHQA
jgi:hypothetical protein